MGLEIVLWVELEVEVGVEGVVVEVVEVVESAERTSLRLKMEPWELEMELEVVVGVEEEVVEVGVLV